MKRLTLALLLATPTHAEPAASMIDASQVRLLPGSPFYERQELHRTGYVGSLDPDRLLFEYRKFAHLPQPQGITGYGGWDSGFIRGHMAGHYLSAASRLAATGDESFRKKADYLVAELAKCQQALGQDGYLAAFPTSALDFLEGKGNSSGGVLVPYYTIHKIMAGLVDAHHYLGNKQALEVALKMSTYLQKRLAALTPEEIERQFRTDKSKNPQNEFGGMADVLAELYSITGDEKHLMLANLFNRPWLVDPLAAGEDRLRALHANTHVAQVAGIARYANVSGDEKTARASENFWSIVTSHHSFVIGGNSFKEWFDAPGVEAGPSIQDRLILPPTTAESCNTQNMLKLTSRLIERAPENAVHADYFERALYNHLLASIAPDTGAMTYFLPLYGNFRTYLNGTHCCVGSGIENVGRYNEGIYYQHAADLWVNLYIPSALNWASQDLVLKQEGNIPFTDTVKFTVTRAARPTAATLHLRIPFWVAGPVEVTVNGQSVTTATATPSSYLPIHRTWKKNDVVTLRLPAALRIERAQDVPSMLSLCYGPLVLAGRLGNQNMPADFADKDAHLKIPAAVVPPIIHASQNPQDWLTLEDPATLTFRVRNAGPATGITFQPLFNVHHERYSVYWPYSATEAPPSASSAATAVAPPGALNQVIPGNDASEASHDLLMEKSTTGKLPTGQTWRDADPDGAFSFVLALPPPGKQPALACTYWSGAESTFDVIVNGVTITTQRVPASKPGQFTELTSPLPQEALTGQQNITVRFQGTRQGRIASVLSIRLTTP